MRVLVATNMYPSPEMPAFGTFVHDQVAALRRAGVEVDVLFINGRQSKWNYLRGFSRYWRQLRQGGYDLVHAHYVLTGVIARAQWGTRVVLTHHGVEALGYPRWQARLCKVMTPLFDAAIHVSEEVRRTLRDADGWVIPCGVDLDAFRPLPRDEARAQLGLSPDKRLILWAGEPWRPEKQFHLVERALPLVQEALPDAELVWCCDVSKDNRARVAPMFPGVPFTSDLAGALNNLSIQRSDRSPGSAEPETATTRTFDRS